jgi:hypothetical protein
MKRWVICVAVLFFGIVGVWGQEATPEITPEATPLPLLRWFPFFSDAFTFLHPANWIVVQPYDIDYNARYFYSIALHNSLRILGKESLDGYSGFAEYDSGEVTVQIRLRGCDTDMGDDELIIEDFDALTPSPNASPAVEHILVGDQRAVRTPLDIVDGDGMLLLLSVEQQRVCILVHLRSAEGELSQWEPTAIAIAESIQLPVAVGAPG